VSNATTKSDPETIALLRAGLALPERPKVCGGGSGVSDPCSRPVTHFHQNGQDIIGSCAAHACGSCIELPRLASESIDALAAEIARTRECLLAILDVADPDGAVAVLAKAAFGFAVLTHWVEKERAKQT
jgi:hypothetical protein